MSQFKISTRLAGLLTALCLLVLLVGGAGLFGMGQSNAGLKSVYDDRVVPLKQIKVVADMYAVNVVDTAHKVRDGAMTPAQGVRATPGQGVEGIVDGRRYRLGRADFAAARADDGALWLGDGTAPFARFTLSDPLRRGREDLAVIQLIFPSGATALICPFNCWVPTLISTAIPGSKSRA